MTTALTIGIIGNGFVGRATRLLQNPEVSVLIYDIRPEGCVPAGLQLEHLDAAADLIFLCLPTPMRPDGECDTSILEQVLARLKNPLCIVRSTVPAGFCDQHHCYFMPEFLTELNWAEDFRTSPHWILGLLDDSLAIVLQDRMIRLLQSAHHHGKILSDRLHFVRNSEAEMIKLFKNVFLATKVSFCNELFDLCVSLGIRYEEVAALVALDPRIGATHLSVPGYNGRRGFGGTCFPKDSHNLLHLFQQHGLPAPVLEAVLRRNEFIDCPERPWLLDHGRTTLHNNNSHQHTILLLIGDSPRLLPRIQSLLPPHQHTTLIHIAESFCPTTSFSPPLSVAHYHQRRVNLRSSSDALFFPRIDGIFFLLQDSLISMNLVLRAKDLADLHHCSIHYFKEKEDTLAERVMRKLHPSAP